MAVETKRLSIEYRGQTLPCKIQFDIPDYPVYAYDRDEHYIMVMWCSGDSQRLGQVLQEKSFRQKVEKELQKHYHMPARFLARAAPKEEGDWTLAF
mgnify:CR=1 FL=1